MENIDFSSLDNIIAESYIKEDMVFKELVGDIEADIMAANF